ncbi:hypothetical protein AVEN_7729-1, partial [Araneus ventricosus]
STEYPPCMWAYRTLNQTPCVRSPPAGVVRQFGEEVPAQVSSSPSDGGSKRRDSSQNSPRVAVKYPDITLTKQIKPNLVLGRYSIDLVE